MLLWERLTIVSKLLGVGAVPGYHGRAASYKNSYSPELMGLRGVAILLVVVGHLLQRLDRFNGADGTGSWEGILYFYFATPFSGCCIFCFISGYLLFVKIARADVGSSVFWVKNYGMSRIVRIATLIMSSSLAL